MVAEPSACPDVRWEGTECPLGVVGRSNPERLFGCGRRGISWEPPLSMLAPKYKYRVAEIAADEPKRLGGKRKLRALRWGGAFYLQFLLEVVRPRNQPLVRKAARSAGTSSPAQHSAIARGRSDRIESGCPDSS